LGPHFFIVARIAAIFGFSNSVVKNTHDRKTTAMPKQVYLIRHGETAWSLTGQHTGRTDLPLTANGEHLASRQPAWLQSIAFDHVLTSPLMRARQTCSLAGFAYIARSDPDLQEWDYGDYEGLTSPEIHSTENEWDVLRDGAPGGESVAQLLTRVDRVIATLGGLEGRVAVFSHGHFLRALSMRWIGLPPTAGRHFPSDTAAIIRLGYEHPDRATNTIVLWNAVA
jgi:broad specificity phosphatase PhoE